MKNLVINDEEGGIRFYVGMEIAEGDIDSIEGIMERLFRKMQKLEKQAPTPEGTRLNILEYSHDTLWKAQVEAKRILDEMQGKVSGLSSGQLFNQAAHARIYRQMDDYEDRIDRLEYNAIQEKKAGRNQDKLLSNIEKFLGAI